MAVQRESSAWAGDDGMLSAALNGNRLLAAAVVFTEIVRLDLLNAERRATASAVP